MSKAYSIAVVGATGNVGREMLQILKERNFPCGKVVALASKRSVGREVSFGKKDILKVQDLATFDFSNTDIGLFSPGGSISAQYAPLAAKAGCVVIDNTSHFRMDENVPLVVPEVNPEALKDHQNIIANPNCSTIQMVVALKPLHKAFGIKRVVVSTYQSVSGAGKSAMDELYHQTKGIYSSDIKEPEQFTKRIAFNVIPHIDVFKTEGEYEGYTKEEWKMMVETKKILDESVEVVATCVRCPVFIGHAESITIETDKPITADAARNILREAEGIAVIDEMDDGGYITPVEAAGDDVTYISRIRKDPTVKNGLVFWCVSDNMRKGAALNSVQIAESMIAQKLL